MSSVAFGQSKKKQIESLNKKVDSLNYVLEIERKLYKEQIDKIFNNIVVLASSHSRKIWQKIYIITSSEECNQ